MRVAELFCVVMENGSNDEEIIEWLEGEAEAERWSFMVTGDKDYARYLLQSAINLKTGKRLRLLRFAVRQEVEVVDP